MNEVSSSARNYRRLGYLAMAHAVALFGLLLLVFSVDDGVARDWLIELWVALVTLWFFWLFVLALHRGRSALRFGVFALLSALVLGPSLIHYNSFAPDAFGLPMGMSMNPVSVWNYSKAYLAGRREAREDVAADRLAYETSGFGAGGGLEVQRILRERFQIEIRPIAGCVVDDKILGHEAGYNSVAMPEIDRRIGWTRVEAAREEGYELQRKEYERQEQSIRELTKRLSKIPADAKVTTKLISPYVDDQVLEDAALEPQLAQFVHAIEQSVLDSVPDSAPSFELRISAKLTPKSRPSFEMSGSLDSPQPVWQAISSKLDAITLPEWSKGSLSVRFEFLIQPPR